MFSINNQAITGKRLKQKPLPKTQPKSKLVPHQMQQQLEAQRERDLKKQVK
jgi:hypothetical protein